MAHSTGFDHFVFVYGTLKRGGSNHRLLVEQRFVGEARLATGYALYSLGDYPGLVADAASRDEVTGEVWAVTDDALARLDELEGLAEGLYARVPARLGTVPTEFSKGAAPKVELYLYLRPVTGCARVGATWPLA